MSAHGLDIPNHQSLFLCGQPGHNTNGQEQRKRNGLVALWAAAEAVEERHRLLPDDRRSDSDGQSSGNEDGVDRWVNRRSGKN